MWNGPILLRVVQLEKQRRWIKGITIFESCHFGIVVYGMYRMVSHDFVLERIEAGPDWTKGIVDPALSVDLRGVS